MENIKLTTSVLESKDSILLKDITTYSEDRNNYIVNVLWKGETNQEVFSLTNEHFERSWVLNADKQDIYDISLYAIPEYMTVQYHIADIVFIRQYNELTNTFENILYRCNTDVIGEYPTSSLKWNVVDPNISSDDLEDILSVAANVSLGTTKAEIATSRYNIKKSGKREYTITSPYSDKTISIYLHSFEDYINNRPHLEMYKMESNREVVVTLPKDGIYILLFKEYQIVSGDETNPSMRGQIEVVDYGDINSYYVIYSFDDMREIMKDILQRILCCKKSKLCTVPNEKQKEHDRLLITKAAVCMGTLIGMIHSEKTFHYYYFDMNEQRLSSLQRANDILQKVLLMFGEYKTEVKCCCHLTDDVSCGGDKKGEKSCCD